MLDINTVSSIYEGLFQEVYNKPNFVFKLTKHKEKVLESFIENVPITAGNIWLKDYILFQLFIHSNNFKRHRGIINLSMIFGGKALARWKDRTDQQMYYYQVFKNNNNIRLNQVMFRAINHIYDEVEKQRFLHTTKGLAHCISLSLSYNGSKNCLKCKMKNLCINLKTNV